MKLLNNPIFKSLAVTTIIALIFSSLLHLLNSKYKILPVTGLAILFQLVFFAIYYTFLDWWRTNKTAVELAQYQANVISSALTDQSLKLECAYCTLINTVPIVLAEENLFECFSCKQKNAVKLNFFAARVTEPVARKIETNLIRDGLPGENPEGI